MALTLKSKLAVALIGSVAALSLSGPAAAAVLGYQLTFNDPLFNTANGVNNVPDLQLTNISDMGSGFQITDFNLTIGDIAFSFDFVRNESAPIDTGDILSATLNAPDFNNNNVGTDFLDYDFLGFDPGDAWQFEVDVDPDAGPVVQDYRQIIFPTGVVEVTFSNGVMLSQTLDALPNADSYVFSQSIDVPEPSTLALFGSFALIGAGLSRRLRSKG